MISNRGEVPIELFQHIDYRERPPIVWLRSLVFTGGHAESLIKLGQAASSLGYARVMRNHLFFSENKRKIIWRHRLARLLGRWTKWEVFNLVFALKSEQRKEAYDMVRNLMRDSYIEGEIRAIRDLYHDDEAKISYHLNSLHLTSPVLAIPDSNVSEGTLAILARRKQLELFLLKLAKVAATVSFMILLVDFIERAIL